MPRKEKNSTMRCGRKNKKKLTDISDGISRGKLRQSVKKEKN